eukprot:2219731-Pyramimonas_sp.AAC.1
MSEYHCVQLAGRLRVQLCGPGVPGSRGCIKKEKEAHQLLASAPRHSITADILRSPSALCFPFGPRDLQRDSRASMYRVALTSQWFSEVRGRFAWLEDEETDRLA